MVIVSNDDESSKSMAICLCLEFLYDLPIFLFLCLVKFNVDDTKYERQFNNSKI
jgi:hypothetical protein